MQDYIIATQSPLSSMHPQRFFVNPQQANLSGDTAQLSQPGLINQIRNVLRLKPGAGIILLDGCGNLYHCRLSKINRQDVQVEILSREPAGGEPSLPISIALPLLKGGRFEWALEKMTELGVNTVIPVIPERAVVRLPLSRSGQGPDGKTGNKLHHWQEIVKEAAEQCERAVLPHIRDPIALSDFLGAPVEPPGASLKLICVERQNLPRLADIVHTLDIHPLPPPGVCLVVGPEGGLTAEELRLSQEYGWQMVSLGPRIFRSETAAIYALAQIISQVDS